MGTIPAHVVVSATRKEAQPELMAELLPRQHQRELEKMRARTDLCGSIASI